MSVPPTKTKPLRLGPSEITATAGYVPSLDGLRAVSILIVVIAHISRISALPGGFGVTIFFFISGYIITRLMFLEFKQTGRVDFADFYLRRVARLYPILFVFVLASLAVLWLQNLPVNWIEIFSVLFYFANYYPTVLANGAPTSPTGMGIFWSLSVEEHFYLLFPLIFSALVIVRRRLLFAALIVCAGSFLIRAAYHVTLPAELSQNVNYFHSESRFDSIAYGVLLAICLESESWRQRLLRFFTPLPVLAAFVVILGTLVFRDAAFREVFRYSIQGMALFLIIGAILTQSWLEPVQRLLNTKPAIFIGKISYSLYVWHLFAAYLCHSIAAYTGHAIYTIVAISLAFALSVISFNFVEKPFILLRKRINPVRKPIAT